MTSKLPLSTELTTTMEEALTRWWITGSHRTGVRELYLERDLPFTWACLFNQARAALELEQEVARLRGLVLGSYRKSTPRVLPIEPDTRCDYCGSEWYDYGGTATRYPEWHNPNCPVPPLQK